MLMLSFRDHRDFVLAVRCLANRCEAVPVQPTVHAKAISGLIHWGLIRKVERRTPCQQTPFPISLPLTNGLRFLRPGGWNMS